MKPSSVRWTMRLALALVLALAAASRAAPVAVEAVAGGQYYHRPGHLEIDERERLTLSGALARGLAPCPECAPPRLVEGQLVVRAPSAYYERLLEYRRAGALWSGLPPPPGSAAAWATEDVLSAAPARAPPPRSVAAPAPDFPDAIAVPGTGGLLTVPTFKGSGGIVAVPLPMGGYTVVEPPRPMR